MFASYVSFKGSVQLCFTSLVSTIWHSGIVECNNGQSEVKVPWLCFSHHNKQWQPHLACHGFLMSIHNWNKWLPFKWEFIRYNNVFSHFMARKSWKSANGILCQFEVSLKEPGRKCVLWAGEHTSNRSLEIDISCSMLSASLWFYFSPHTFKIFTSKIQIFLAKKTLQRLKETFLTAITSRIHTSSAFAVASSPPPSMGNRKLQPK